MTLKTVLLFGTALLIAAPAFADDRVDVLLAEAKAATGGQAWDRITSWHEQGVLQTNGLDGTYEAWADLPGARRAIAITLGALSEKEGWTGKQAWSTDSSGQVRIEEAGDAVSNARQEVYEASLAYWYPTRMPAERSYAGEKQEEGVLYDAIKVTPQDAEPLELWFDRRTHRIARAVQLTGDHPHSDIYSDFRKVGSVTVPFRTRQTTGDRRFDVVSVASTIEFSPAPEGRFDPPPPPKDDAVFPAGTDRVTLPFELVNNHIYLPASLDGGAPIDAVFDTGAINILDKGEAASLGLKSEGTLPGGGFGPAQSEIGITKTRSLEIGGLKLDNQVFFTIDLAKSETVEGRKMNMLVGYELAKRAVTVIDYAGRKITFLQPAAFHPPAGAVAVPFKFNEHTPMIQAVVDGIAGEFEVDTGARSSLTLMRPFSEAHGLAEKYHATRNVVAGYGVGGPTRGLLFRPETLTIGSLTLKQPVGNLQIDKTGAAADPRSAGNIGGGVLRRFTLTLDYGHQTLYLEPNADFAAPDVFDRAGLWFSRAADGFVIDDVIAGSAAAKAGLAIGDHITAIDGNPAGRLTNAALRDRFKAAPGSVVKLAVTGAAGPHEVTLTLADLI